MTPHDVLNAAQAWYMAGFCVVPPRADGTKAPLVDWKRYQSVRPDRGQMSRWYEEGTQYGIGLLCGAVSGGLELVELEGRVATDQWFMTRLNDALHDAGLLDLWELLEDGYSEYTPSGGLHLLYRIADHEVPGNTKIATRPKDPAHYTDRDRETLARAPKAVIMETLIETRGEGGYVVVAPSQGPVHPSGNPWTMGHKAQPGLVPTITWAEREKLFACLARFDVPRPQPEVAQVPKPVHSQDTSTGDRVGDDFNANGDWGFLLEHGWTVSPRRGDNGETLWVRPGKKWTEGHSASTGYAADGDRLYIWSSGTQFPTETPLSRFHVYTQLEHGGDYKAAARALGAKGFGKPLPPRVPQQRFGDFVPSYTSPVAGQPTDETDQPVARSFEQVVGYVQPAVPPRRSYCQTSVGNAERLVDMFGKDFRFVPVKGDAHWMAWDGVRWREDHGNGRVNAANTQMTYMLKDEADQVLAADPESKDGKRAYQWFTSSQMDRGMKGTLSQFSQRPEVIAQACDFDQHLGYLNLPNGIYNLDTHELGEHKRSMMFTNLFGTHFDPAAKAPKFEQFMETVVPDPQMRRFLQRAIGYTLTGRPNQRAMMILWGLKRTGKSQFVELMQKLFGDYGYTAMAGTFHKVDKRGDAATPGQHSLKGKRFVSISETDEDAVLDENAIKRFTGTDSVSTRALYRGDENWKPQLVLWIVTNHKPLLSPDDTAVWDRVKLAHFPTQFSAKGGEGTLKEVPDYAELLFAEEAPGILNWALDGLREFQELGGLAEPEQVALNAEAYRREVDPVSQFFDEHIEGGQLLADDEARVDAKVLYRAYVYWCEENRLRAIVGPRRFQSRIRSRLNLANLPRSNSVTWIPGWKWTGLTWHGGAHQGLGEGLG